MKILIAYDGSDCADAALEDLHRAGLPAYAEALVVSVADVFLPPQSSDESIDATTPLYTPPGGWRSHAKAARAVEKSLDLAVQASERVQASFPGWNVRAEAYAQTPAWGILSRAGEWAADLIVVGAQGRLVLDRFILGNVSQRILYEAHCSVRVVRCNTIIGGSAPRVVIGVDGSPDAEDALKAVATRSWPVGTEIRVVGVLDTVMSLTSARSNTSVGKWGEKEDKDSIALEHNVFETLREKLRDAGVTASSIVRRGGLKRALLEEAKRWEADSIFIGVKGLKGLKRFLVGSVSVAVASRASCSVEIIRPRHTT